MPTLQILTAEPVPVPATVAVAAGLLLLAFLYRSILPKPLIGIPYNRSATRTPLGDLPSLLPHLNATGNFTSWILDQVSAKNTPIFQVFFLFPFWKPAVIVSDAREIHDILVRRTPKDFDRSHVMRSLLYGIAPEHHVMLPTGAEWRAHRRLTADLMSPSYLRGRPSESIYQTVVDLVKLWEVKASMAGGLPFSVKEDVHYTALDSIMKFLFGEDAIPTATRTKLDHLSRLQATLPFTDSVVSPTNSKTGNEFNFPQTPNIDPRISTTLYLCDILEEFWKTPFRRLKWLYLKTTKLRTPMASKRAFILEQINLSLSRMQNSRDESNSKSALDSILTAERNLAIKESRQPDYTSPLILDEIFGFIVAGHDTTSTTLMWSVKLLANYKNVQSKLRTVLREAFTSPSLSFSSSGCFPTLEQIHSTQVPYLDAVMEELLRCSPTLPINLRDTVRETTILGHRIPKGTMVFLHQAAHGITLPPFDIPESERSDSDKASSKKSAWQSEDIGIFRPERWLTTDGDGNVRFDNQAGQHLAFGAGVRGCYGRRMAYIMIRTFVVLVVWRFVLEVETKTDQGCEKDGDAPAAQGLRLKLPLEGGVDGITHKPPRLVVRLGPVFS